MARRRRRRRGVGHQKEHNIAGEMREASCGYYLTDEGKFFKNNSYAYGEDGKKKNDERRQSQNTELHSSRVVKEQGAFYGNERGGLSSRKMDRNEEVRVGQKHRRMERGNDFAYSSSKYLPSMDRHTEWNNSESSSGKDLSSIARRKDRYLRNSAEDNSLKINCSTLKANSNSCTIERVRSQHPSSRYARGKDRTGSAFSNNYAELPRQTLGNIISADDPSMSSKAVKTHRKAKFDLETSTYDDSKEKKSIPSMITSNPLEVKQKYSEQNIDFRGHSSRVRHTHLKRRHGCRTTFFDSMQKRSMPSDINSNSSEVKHSYSEQCRRLKLKFEISGSSQSHFEPDQGYGMVPHNPETDSNSSKVKNANKMDTRKSKEKEKNESSDHNIQQVNGVASTSLGVVQCGFGSSERVLASEIIKKEPTNSTQEKGEKDNIANTQVGKPIVRLRRKLLVLDLNGLLADILYVTAATCKAPKKVGGKSVFKRPFCDDFLDFCFKLFDIGVWSSRTKTNVDAVVDYLMGDRKCKLLFCWDQSMCTSTGFKTVDNSHKPLVLKELKKLWNKEDRNLPWEKGLYSPSNTLLIDDSPYKALCNPPHTAIFPRPYSYTDENDNSLGPGGDLRVYLEGLAMADDVLHYVREHPFGQLSITEANPSWRFYLRIIEKFKDPASCI